MVYVYVYVLYMYMYLLLLRYMKNVGIYKLFSISVWIFSPEGFFKITYCCADFTPCKLGSFFSLYLYVHVYLYVYVYVYVYIYVFVHVYVFVVVEIHEKCCYIQIVFNISVDFLSRRVF